MNQFIEECRREWRRLRVPGPIAEEMAAELAADLKDAEAEGISPEEVLGSAAFDPRSFASSWAAERGVISERRLRERPVGSVIHIAIAALTIVAAVGAALAILAPPESGWWVRPPSASSPAASPSPEPRVVIVGPGPLERHAADINTAGSILLVVGIAGIILSLLFLLWSSRARLGRAVAG
jgi:hypothetical protein